jgi:hypothetical protein
MLSTFFCYAQSEDAYIEATYGSQDRLTRSFASVAITTADAANAPIPAFIDDYSKANIIENMSKVQKILSIDFDLILMYWNKSTSTKHVDLSTVMSILKTELARKGVPDNIEKCMALIRADIRTLNKNEKQNTLNLYAVLSQYQDIIANISGSYRSFAQTRQSLSSDFAKTLSLAKLEW